MEYLVEKFSKMLLPKEYINFYNISISYKYFDSLSKFYADLIFSFENSTSL